MKKLSMILMLAFVCGSFAMAQTSNVSKKATLMEAGSVVSDLKTGEVLRTNGGSIPASDINISGTTSYTSSGETAPGTAEQRIKPFEGAANTTLTPSAAATGTNNGATQQNIKAFNGGAVNTLTATPTTAGTVPTTTPNIVKPPVNSNQTFSVD